MIGRANYKFGRPNLNNITPMAAPRVHTAQDPVKKAHDESNILDNEMMGDPKYADGRLSTKFLADQTDHNNLEHSNFYATYQGKMLSGVHKTKYSVRTSFNNEQKGLDFWFADAYAETKHQGHSWTFRAILNPTAYFMATYKYKLPAGFSVRVGGETEVGKTPRHFVKVRKDLADARINTFLSGDLTCDGSNLIDTVSFKPLYVLKFKDPLSKIKKAKFQATLDIDVSGGQFKQKRDISLATKVKLAEGNVFAQIEVGRDLALNSDIAAYHSVARHFGLYAAYKGSLARFDGLKTIGSQVTVPEFGKIRTSVNSDYVLKNVFMYNVHPFASLVQHTEFNLKTKEDLHLGLGLALGN